MVGQTVVVGSVVVVVGQAVVVGSVVVVVGQAVVVVIQGVVGVVSQLPLGHPPSRSLGQLKPPICCDENLLFSCGSKFDSWCPAFGNWNPIFGNDFVIDGKLFDGAVGKHFSKTGAKLRYLINLSN